jgi:hypothetical protein
MSEENTHETTLSYSYPLTKNKFRTAWLRHNKLTLGLFVTSVQTLEHLFPHAIGYFY